jgi:DNA-binding SARP family transcriptional activator
MARVRVSVLGPARLEVDGETVPLTPLTVRLLVRLVAAEGEAVSVPQLRKDVWDTVDVGFHADQRGRNEVQKRVFELRRHLPDPDSLRTEQLVAGPRPVTRYRLVLGPGELDLAEFEQSVNAGLHATPAAAEHLLAAAIALWRGQPLVEAGDAAFARALLGRLHEMQQTARTELVRVRLALGRAESALPLAEKLAAERPDDPVVAAALGQARERMRARHGNVVLRQEYPELHSVVTVVAGDLFDQHDANLVVGFSDTFDVVTEDDFVISRASVQGQAAERLFGGSSKELDRALKRGLRNVAPVAVESARDKPRGKRIRYPVGTVVPIPLDGRRIFATAYSQLGNDLVARSAPQDLRHSLDRLWEAVARYGMVKPVAVPLVGSGLARLRPLRREELIALIVESFIAGCGRLPAVTPELRIVLLAEELEKTNLSAVKETLAGMARHTDPAGER